MARSLNKHMIIGNVGGDPDIRTVGDAKVANFSVATSEVFKNKSGEKQEKTQWHRVVAWRGLADIIEQYLKKGDRVYVEGTVEHREVEDNKNPGAKRYFTETIAQQIVLLGGGQGGNGNGSSNGGQQRASRPSAPPANVPDDDDLPF